MCIKIEAILKGHMLQGRTQLENINRKILNELAGKENDDVSNKM